MDTLTTPVLPNAPAIPNPPAKITTPVNIIVITLANISTQVNTTPTSNAVITPITIAVILNTNAINTHPNTNVTNVRPNPNAINVRPTMATVTVSPNTTALIHVASTITASEVRPQETLRGLSVVNCLQTLIQAKLINPHNQGQPETACKVLLLPDKVGPLLPGNPSQTENEFERIFYRT
jgi:hypothetical protein